VLEKLPIILPKLRYEHHPFAADESRELHADAWLERDDRPESLEFTHRADRDASVAVIASYVLTKVQDYARDYRLL
jgi:hypothetical protein